MHIGIDASRAFVENPTGTENYSLRLIEALSRIDGKNRYTLYLKNLPSTIYSRGAGSRLVGHLPSNFSFKKISLTYLWTQVGLALECLINPPDVLFIPAHTLPVIRRPGLKTVVTIHDLGSEFLPQYHQFPQKIYQNFATIYAVKNATKLIAVSKSTKKNLIKKLGGDPNKIAVVYEACLPAGRAYR